MTFLAGDQLSDAIHEILREDDLRLAIAFWGSGASERVIGKRAKAICNLASGGTNPHAIRTLIDRGTIARDDLRQCDHLHAKVYVGGLNTIVASANLSANGLGLEGIEQAGWTEAGAAIETTAEIQSWFNGLWLISQPITDEDIARAEKAYKFRQKVKPTRGSIARFDVDQDRLPLLRQVGDAGISYDEQQIIKSLGSMDTFIKTRLDDGVELISASDRERLTNRWILTWARNGRSIGETSWIESSNVIVPKAFSFDDDEDVKYDTILSVEVSTPKPFEVSSVAFKKSLSYALSKQKFIAFREWPWDDEGGWKKEDLLKEFWSDVRDEYLRSA